MMIKNPIDRIDANNLIKYLNDNFNQEAEINQLSFTLIISLINGSPLE